LRRRPRPTLGCGAKERRKKEDIKMDLKEIGCEDVNWIHLAQEGYVRGCCKHGTEPLGSVKGEFHENLRDFSFSRRTLLHGVRQSVNQSIN
jgi:hypothetical protein